MSEQRRIFLWSAPRSVSTAFFRAMMNRTKTKVLLEPYSIPYHYGPEKVTKRHNDTDDDDEFKLDMTTYGSATEELQQPYPEWGSFDRADVGIEELYFMFCQVTEKLQQKAIVIDADDLIQNPELILKLYCKHTGVTFQSSMLDWDENDAKSEVFRHWAPWFKDVLSSKSFRTPSADKKNKVNISLLPTKIQEIITESMEYYRKMYEVSLKPSCETEMQSIPQ